MDKVEDDHRRGGGGRDADEPLPFWPAAVDGTTGKRRSSKHRLYLLFDDPADDAALSSRYVNLFVWALIISSCACFVVETLPTFHDSAMMHALEAFFVFCFSTEYVVKLVSVTDVPDAVAFGPPSAAEGAAASSRSSARTRRRGGSFGSVSEAPSEIDAAVPAADDGVEESGAIGKIFRFVMKPEHLVDLAAILPFYIQLYLHLSHPDSGGESGGAAPALRMLRMFRLSRLGKLLKYNDGGGSIVVTVLVQSLPVLEILGFLTVVATVFISSLIFYAETSHRDPETGLFLRPVGPQGVGHDVEFEVSPFQSIPDAFWISIVTFTTVGYGDHTPVTPMGKVIMTIAMMYGVIVMALPIGVISTNFNNEFERLTADKTRKRKAEAKTMVRNVMRSFRQRRKTSGRMSERDKDDLRAAFNIMDTDNSQTIETSELGTIINALGTFLSEAQLVLLASAMDVGGDGAVQVEEFIVFLEDRGFAMLEEFDAENSAGVTHSKTSSFATGSSKAAQASEAASTAAALERLSAQVSEQSTSADARMRRLESAIVSIDRQLRDLVGNISMDVPVAVAPADVEAAFQRKLGNDGQSQKLHRDEFVRQLTAGPSGLSLIQVKSLLRKVPVDDDGNISLTDILARMKISD